MAKNEAPAKYGTGKLHDETLLTHAGSSPENFHGFVNPPVVHASTVLFPDVETMANHGQKYAYGRRGTPTSEALEDAITALEGAAGTKLATSGLNAITLALLSVLQAGDHLLIVDTCYAPTREFAQKLLPRYGIEVDYFDPRLGAEVKNLFKPNTKALFLEAPGSLTMEMLDFRSVLEPAKSIGAKVLMDNTWATPLFFKPLQHGIDLSIQAATKYIVGHSDTMLGSVAANAESFPALLETHGLLGLSIGPDDIYLGLRGLRTMSARLERHMRSATAIATWLQNRPEVAAVRYPALASDPGHAFWKEYFTGASGLFTFDFVEGTTAEQTATFLNTLDLFGLGYSWGGFESLAIPVKLKGIRSATIAPDAQMVRLQIGLENVDDLLADIEQALKAAFG